MNKLGALPEHILDDTIPVIGIDYSDILRGNDIIKSLMKITTNPSAIYYNKSLGSVRFNDFRRIVNEENHVAGLINNIRDILKKSSKKRRDILVY
jgi:hypothetical protein